MQHFCTSRRFVGLGGHLSFFCVFALAALLSGMSNVLAGMSNACEPEQDRSVAGVVVDANDKPIPGANVVFRSEYQKLSTKCSPKGEFSVVASQKSRDPASEYVIASAEGFRTNGLMIANAPSPLKIRLFSIAELPTPEFFPAKSNGSSKDRRESFRELFEPIFARLDSIKEPPLKAELVCDYSCYSSSDALQYVTKKPMQHPFFQMYCLLAIAKNVAGTSIEEACAVCDDIANESMRVTLYLRIINSLPPEDVKTRRELLMKALIQARKINKVEDRVSNLGRVAVKLFQAGETDLARKVVEEVKPLALKLPGGGPSGSARNEFALALSFVDRRAAEELFLAGIEQREKINTLTRLAILHAKGNPDYSEHLLLTQLAPSDGQFNTFHFGQCAVKVGNRMATVDSERALSLVRMAKHTRKPTETDQSVAFITRATNIHQAQGLALIAHSIAKTYSTKAKALVREAYSILEAKAVDSISDFDNFVDTPTVAASLLPTVEVVDGTMIDEFLWRSLALRPDPSQAGTTEQGRSNLAKGDCSMAPFIAKYSPELGRALLREHAEYLCQTEGQDATLLFLAGGFVAPNDLRRWLDLVGNRENRDRYTEFGLRLMVANEDEQWRRWYEKLLVVWHPDFFEE